MIELENNQIGEGGIYIIKSNWKNLRNINLYNNPIDSIINLVMGDWKNC